MWWSPPIALLSESCFYSAQQQNDKEKWNAHFAILLSALVLWSFHSEIYC
jgi:hypothetical protein